MEGAGLPEELVHILHGIREGEDRDAVVGLYVGAANGYETVSAAYDAAYDGVCGELDVLELLLGNAGAGGGGVFKDFGISAADITHGAYFV